VVLSSLVTKFVLKINLATGSMVGTYFSHGFGVYSHVFGVYASVQWFPKQYINVPFLLNIEHA